MPKPVISPTPSETETDLTTDDGSDSPDELPSTSKHPPPSSKPIGKAVIPPKQTSHPSDRPLDKDKKPPPPPIIGPDGKEVPRPRDAKGNPLPIYVTPDGKPIFDEDGKPMPLKLDKDGNPIPLLVPGPPSRDQVSESVPPAPKKKVGVEIFWVGVADLVLSLSLTAYLLTNYIPFLKDDPGVNPTTSIIPSQDEKDFAILVVATLCLNFIGIAFTGFPMVASKMNSRTCIWVWIVLCGLLFFSQIYICFATFALPLNEPGLTQGVYATLTYFCIRWFVTFCIACAVFCGGNENIGYGQGQYTYSNASGFLPGQYYPGQGQQIPSVPPGQLVQLQQPQPITTTQTIVYPQTSAMLPSYGYGYPSYGGYGMGYGMGMGLGYAGGMGMYGGGYGGWGYPHHHHHHHDWF